MSGPRYAVYQLCHKHNHSICPEVVATVGTQLGLVAGSEELNISPSVLFFRSVSVRAKVESMTRVRAGGDD